MTARDLLFVINRPGIQSRRAAALLEAMGGAVRGQVLVEPAPAEAWRHIKRSGIVYVIDAGRCGFPAVVMARAASRPTIVELGDPQGPLFKAQSRGRAAVAMGWSADQLIDLLASHVVVRGTALAAELGIRTPWTYIPDGVNLAEFQPGDGAAIRRDLGVPEGCLVVGLIGSLKVSGSPPRCYGWDVVEAVARLGRDDVWALVVGGGSGEAWLRERAGELGIADRVVLSGQVPHDQVPACIQAMDVCVSTQTDDAIGRSRTTSKLPEYLACDKYVLASNVGTAAAILPPEMLLTYRGTWDPGYPDRLAGALEPLATDREAPRKAGTRSIAEREFDYQVLGQRVLSLIEQLT